MKTTLKYSSLFRQLAFSVLALSFGCTASYSQENSGKNARKYQEIVFQAARVASNGEFYGLDAMSTSHLPVSYYSPDGIIQGGKFFPKHSGTMHITAMQPGDSKFLPARDVVLTFVHTNPESTASGDGARVEILNNPVQNPSFYPFSITLNNSIDGEKGRYQVLNGSAAVYGSLLTVYKPGDVQVRRLGYDGFGQQANAIKDFSIAFAEVEPPASIITGEVISQYND